MSKSTSSKIKELVRVRFKKLSDGNQSIYLEKYEGYKFTKEGTITTKKSYEFLKLYLIPEKTKADKLKNQETLSLANAIKSRKIVELQNNQHGFKNTSLKIKTNLVDYIRFLADEALAKSGIKRSYYYTLNSVANHITVYANDFITFEQVNYEFVLGFINYLKTAQNFNHSKNKKKERVVHLSQNTQHNLFNKFAYVIRKALKDDIITSNPLEKLEVSDKPKSEKSQREFLTIDEIKKLIKTECSNDTVKRAFIFCCLSGLRYCDVANIKWCDLWEDNFKNTILRLKIRKTKRYEDFPISAEALKWLPAKDLSSIDIIFNLPKNDNANTALKRWAKDANIKKSLSFHCSRHTAATLNLSLGVPIETVSKLLGHTKISTTQIYAKVLDQAKKDAVSKQNGIFDIL